MQNAIEESKKCVNDVPVGCVIKKNGELIAAAHNLREDNNDVTAHAEILAIQQAQNALNSSRLNDCEMYVTLEPCQMCMGAILNARLRKVYIGAQSTTDLNWQTPVELQSNSEAQNILVAFFRDKR